MVFRLLASTALALSAAVLLSLLTLLVPSKVEGPEDMRTIALGLPFHFMTQDRTILDPPSWPRYYAVGSPWEYPFITNPTRFAINTALLFCALVAGYGLLRRLHVRGATEDNRDAR